MFISMGPNRLIVLHVAHWLIGNVSLYILLMRIYNCWVLSLGDRCGKLVSLGVSGLGTWSSICKWVRLVISCVGSTELVSVGVSGLGDSSSICRWMELWISHVGETSWGISVVLTTLLILLTGDMHAGGTINSIAYVPSSLEIGKDGADPVSTRRGGRSSSPEGRVCRNT